jgi:hypothetical protein
MAFGFFDNIRAVVRPERIIVNRNELINDPAAFPQQSVRYQVDVDPAPAPLPVPSTAFAKLGRGPESQDPHQWRYTSLWTDEYLSIQAQGFEVAKVPSALVLSMPTGVQLPFRERVNILAPKQRSLGSQTTVQGLTVVDPALGKLI